METISKYKIIYDSIKSKKDLQQFEFYTYFKDKRTLDQFYIDQTYGINFGFEKETMLMIVQLFKVDSKHTLIDTKQFKLNNNDLSKLNIVYNNIGLEEE
jgi:hypothetical protein